MLHKCDSVCGTTFALLLPSPFEQFLSRYYTRPPQLLLHAEKYDQESQTKRQVIKKNELKLINIHSFKRAVLNGLHEFIPAYLMDKDPYCTNAPRFEEQIARCCCHYHTNSFFPCIALLLHNYYCMQKNLAKGK